MNYVHKPVLLDEAIAALAIQPDGWYVDGTFGRGGHSERILQALGPAGRLVAIDQDPDAIAAGKAKFANESRLTLWYGSFANLKECIAEQGWQGKVDGILLDIGVSSPQLDNSERGFSFLQDGPLDMRMNSAIGMDATTWIASAKQEEIAAVLHEFGEERFARRIAGAIVKARVQTPITRTRQLAEIVAAAHPKWERHKHPATRSFQGIRIFINQELAALHAVLPQALTALKPGGRLAVISFHSLEDRVVKRFMRDKARGDDLPMDLPVTAKELRPTMRLVCKPIKASDAEVDANPRSRSAVLRIAEKLA